MRTVAAQLAQELDTVARADVHVKHDDVDCERVQLLTCLRERGRLVHLPAVELEMESA